MTQQSIDILKSMKSTREEFLKPYNENSIEYIKTKESIMTIDEMIFKLQALGDGWIKPNGQDLVKGDVLAIDYQGNCHIGYLVPYKNDPGFYCQGEETVLDDVEYYQIIIPPNK